MKNNNLRIDYLPNHKEITLYQREDMFRLNTDSALLGEFFVFNDNESLLDIGTNNGVLLLYASIKAKGKLFGIDVFLEALELCKKNLSLHNVEATLIQANAKDYINEKVDVIVSNPPFFKKDGSTPCTNEFLDIARREVLLSLDDLFNTVSNNLKDEGRFYLVHRFDRKEEIIKTANKYKLYLHEIKNVFDKRINKFVTSLLLFKKVDTNEVLENEMIIPQ